MADDKKQVEPEKRDISEELKKLKEELDKTIKEKEEYLAGWQRERAEFLNYKQKEWERISNLLKCANEDLIMELLTIVDSFEMALKQDKIPSLSDEMTNFIKGIEMVYKQLMDILTKHGLTEISTSERLFDPQFDEAIETIVDLKLPEGTILEVKQKGYLLNNKVIRPNKVIISKKVEK